MAKTLLSRSISLQVHHKIQTLTPQLTMAESHLLVQTQSVKLQEMILTFSNIIFTQKLNILNQMKQVTAVGGGII